MPAVRSLIEIGRFRSALEPFVKLYCHARKEISFVHSIPKMFAESAASRISWRPDSDGRHGLADRVDDLLGNALRVRGAGFRFFEAGVKLPDSCLL